MNSPRKHKSKVRQRLETSGDPIRRARLPKRMLIAAKISNALELLDLDNKALAQSLGKYASEISKWLKGDHNFTMDTLSDIEEILKIRLLDVKDSDEEDNVFVFTTTTKVPGKQYDAIFNGNYSNQWQVVAHE